MIMKLMHVTPLYRYLRSREDTVRCIVQSLIDDTNSELADELRQGLLICMDESFYDVEDMDEWKEWKPDPADASEQHQVGGTHVENGADHVLRCSFRLGKVGKGCWDSPNHAYARLSATFNGFFPFLF